MFTGLIYQKKLYIFLSKLKIKINDTSTYTVQIIGRMKWCSEGHVNTIFFLSSRNNII